jgi:hypothetical protein
MCAGEFKYENDLMAAMHAAAACMQQMARHEKGKTTLQQAAAIPGGHVKTGIAQLSGHVSSSMLPSVPQQATVTSTSIAR